MTHVNSKTAKVNTAVDYGSVARIASAVELRDIALRSSRASLNVSADQIPERWSGEAFVGFETTVGEYQPGGSEFQIEAAFIAVYKTSWSNDIFAELPELDPADPPEIEIQASFELSYSTKTEAELAPEDLNNFAIANGTLHAWPYWRELADDITTRMHVPRLVIGVFKIPSRHDPGGRAESSTTAGDVSPVPQAAEEPGGEGSAIESSEP